MGSWYQKEGKLQHRMIHAWNVDAMADGLHVQKEPVRFCNVLLAERLMSQGNAVQFVEEIGAL